MHVMNHLFYSSNPQFDPSDTLLSSQVRTEFCLGRCGRGECCAGNWELPWFGEICGATAIEWVVGWDDTGCCGDWCWCCCCCHREVVRYGEWSGDTVRTAQWTHCVWVI